MLFVECSLVLGSGGLFKYFSFVSTHLIYIFIGSLCYFFFDDSVGSGLSVWKICNERRGVALVGISSVFIFFILAFVSCQKLSDGQMLQSDMVRNYALALICFVFALCVSSAFKRVPALVSIVSKTSFTTYAIHYALASSVLYMLGLLGIPALLNYVLTFVLTFVVGGVLGTCVEIPISKFFRKYLLAK